MLSQTYCSLIKYRLNRTQDFIAEDVYLKQVDLKQSLKPLPPNHPDNQIYFIAMTRLFSQIQIVKEGLWICQIKSTPYIRIYFSDSLVYPVSFCCDKEIFVQFQQGLNGSIVCSECFKKIAQFVYQQYDKANHQSSFNLLTQFKQTCNNQSKKYNNQSKESKNQQKKINNQSKVFGGEIIRKSTSVIFEQKKKQSQQHQRHIRQILTANKFKTNHLKRVFKKNVNPKISNLLYQTNDQIQNNHMLDLNSTLGSFIIKVQSKAHTFSKRIQTQTQICQINKMTNHTDNRFINKTYNKLVNKNNNYDQSLKNQSKHNMLVGSQKHNMLIYSQSIYKNRSLHQTFQIINSIFE